MIKIQINEDTKKIKENSLGRVSLWEKKNICRIYLNLNSTIYRGSQKYTGKSYFVKNNKNKWEWKNETVTEENTKIAWVAFSDEICRMERCYNSL